MIKDNSIRNYIKGNLINEIILTKEIIENIKSS